MLPSIYVLLLVFLLCTSLLCGALQTGNLPTSELAALESLYMSTNGDKWAWKPVDEGNIWNFTAMANPCEQNWQGVACSGRPEDEFRHVASLNLFNYSMHGSVPGSLGNLTHLESCVFSKNHLSGAIPAQPWATMPNLSVLDFSSNNFHDTIPSSIGLLGQLISLDLGDNYLIGSIPESVGQLVQLKTVRLSYNRLYGSIPASLYQLLELTEVDIGKNFLTGSLSESYGYMANLTKLDLEANNIDGSISDTFCALRRLKFLWLNFNYLTGTIPACLSDVTSLVSIETAANSLEGPIPEGLGSLPNLSELDISINKHTGTIPNALCQPEGLFTIYMQHNHLTGTIPNCFGGVTLLTHFAVDHNRLFGTIPVSLGQLTSIQTSWFSDNYLTGTISNFGASTALTEYTLGQNLLTGSIPDCFSALSSLEFLNMTTNFLTGPLPPSMGQLGKAQLIQMNGNLLTGRIPGSFTDLRSILQLYLDNNLLSGSLDGVFDATMQVVMLDVFLNDNQLTGTLPDELFLLPQLNTIVAQGNCFTGTLSATMCESPAMVSLILDGLHTSPACRNDLLLATKSYTTSGNVHGTIPPCLFSMPYLVSLHLAGNGLTGALDSAVAISPQLLDLALAHNILTGTIPASVQLHGWKSLDLSYNRLTGSILSDFNAAPDYRTVHIANSSYNETVGVAVALQNNRLSGRIPSSLVHLQNVSVLGSNMFACKIDKSDLPKHDSDRDNYQCGSDAFNGPFYVVLALIGIVCVSAVYLRHQSHSPGGMMHLIGKWRLDYELLPAHTYYVVNMSDTLCRIGLWCTVLVIVVLMPWYAVASRYFNTYVHQYAWAVSAGLLSGVTPAAIELVLYGSFALLLVTSAAGFVLGIQTRERQRSRSSSRGSRLSSQSSAPLPAKVPVSKPLWQRALVYCLFVLVNMTAVVGVNAAFVTTALTQTNSVLVLAQIVISVFKLVWNTVCTPYIITRSVNFLWPSEKRSGASFVTVQVFVALFNNIAIPSGNSGITISTQYAPLKPTASPSVSNKNSA